MKAEESLKHSFNLLKNNQDDLEPKNISMGKNQFDDLKANGFIDENDYCSLLNAECTVMPFLKLT